MAGKKTAGAGIGILVLIVAAIWLFSKRAVAEPLPDELALPIEPEPDIEPEPIAEPEPVVEPEPPEVVEVTRGLISIELLNPPAGAQYWGCSIWVTPTSSYANFRKDIGTDWRMTGRLGWVKEIWVYHEENGAKITDYRFNPAFSDPAFRIAEYGSYEYDCWTNIFRRVE